MIKKFLITEVLKVRKTFDGINQKFVFKDGGVEIGTIFIDIKRKWYRLHIWIKDEFQGKGYAIQMIDVVINDMGYINIAEGRIVNDNMYKIIEKLKASNKYQYFVTQYGEHIFAKQDIDINVVKELYDYVAST